MSDGVLVTNAETPILSPKGQFGLSAQEIYELLKEKWVMDIMAIYVWEKVDILSIDNFFLKDDEIFIKLRYNTFPILSAKQTNFLSKMVPIFQYIKHLKSNDIDIKKTNIDIATLQNNIVTIHGINEMYFLHKIKMLEKQLLELQKIIRSVNDPISNVVDQDIISKKDYINICDKISKKYTNYYVYLIYLDDKYVCSFNKTLFTHHKYQFDCEINEIINSSFQLYQHNTISMYIRLINNQSSSLINVYEDMEKIKIEYGLHLVNLNK